MKEIDVAITDFILAGLAFVIALRIYRIDGTGSRLKLPFLLLFLGFGAAAAFGGVVHGFTDRDTFSGDILWGMTMIAVGVAAAGFAQAGARMVWRDAGAGVADRVILFAAVVYGVVITFERAFWVAILFYAPATMMTLMGFLTEHRRRPHRRLVIGIAGLCISLAAPAAQIFKISLHPQYFTYNALYHVILIAAVGLFWTGVKEAMARAR